MNRDEDIGRVYLESLGFGSIVHEPDGNHMPDFLVEGRIAVEVRRLNQHARAGDRPQGLENVEASLVRYFDKLLPSLGSADDTGSWWVSYHFRRPLDLKALKRDVPIALRHFAGDRDAGRHTFTLQRNFGMDLQPTTAVQEARFLLGAYSDYDAGGFVGSEIIRNADLCIAEKTAKMLRAKDRYPEWWLLLVDRIGSMRSSVTICRTTSTPGLGTGSFCWIRGRRRGRCGSASSARLLDRMGDPLAGAAAKAGNVSYLRIHERKFDADQMAAWMDGDTPVERQ